MSRLLIRTLAKSYIPALAKYLNNKKIWDNCRDILPYPYIEEDAARFIESALYQDGQHIKSLLCQTLLIINKFLFAEEIPLLKIGRRLPYSLPKCPPIPAV